MEEMKSGTEMGRICKCPHHKMWALLVVLFAAVFFLKALGVLSAATVDWVWPIIVGVGGLTKLFKGMCKCCGGMCGPGGECC